MNDVRRHDKACRTKNFLCAAGMYLFLIVVCIVIIYPIVLILQSLPVHVFLYAGA